MRFFVLLLAAASLPACLIAADNRGYVSAAWQLQTPQGQPVQCLAGETVSISVAGAQYNFPCNQYGGSTGLVPAGTHTVSFAFYPSDGSAAVVMTQVLTVFRRTTTDVGLITFTVQPPAVGSATFTWALHQYQLSAPAEACQPGEQIYFEISGLAAFYTDCYAYSAQPVENLAPGNYTARLSLIYMGQVETGPATVIDTNFVVVAGADTPVHVDFIVESGARREGNAPVRPGGTGGNL